MTLLPQTSQDHQQVTSAIFHLQVLHLIGSIFSCSSSSGGGGSSNSSSSSIENTIALMLGAHTMLG
jgi:hypothetical protein